MVQLPELVDDAAIAARLAELALTVWRGDLDTVAGYFERLRMPVERQDGALIVAGQVCVGLTAGLDPEIGLVCVILALWGPLGILTPYFGLAMKQVHAERRRAARENER